MTCWIYSIRAATIAVLLISVGLFSGSAQAQTAPASTVDHAACYQSVNELDDLFCLTRYELPESISDGVSDAWCAELVNQLGCDGTPADPIEPTSLPPNTVFVTLYDGCTLGDCSAGTILNVSRVPRISFGLAGSYMNPGHTVTYGDPNIALCLESSDVLFTTPSIACQQVTWNSAPNTIVDQRALLGDDLIEQVRAVGILESLPTGQYVSNNLINSNGKLFALEALANADRILDVFSEGASVIVVPGNTPVAGSTVQAQIDANTAAVQTAKTGFGNIFGISGDASGTLISLLVILAMFLVALRFTNLVFALPAAASFGSVMVIYGFLPFQVLAVFIAILALPAAAFMVKRMTA